MKVKTVFFLFIAGVQLSACHSSHPENKHFEWGDVAPHPNLSWADSVGNRRICLRELIRRCRR